jgi:hypothetical protein
MGDNFLKLKALIFSSSLSLAEQEELLLALLLVDDEALSDMVQVCTADPAWVGKISDNFQAKRAAVIMRDPRLWHDICQREAADIVRLSQTPTV